MTDHKKLISLDVLRGLACLLVWISHIRVATHYFMAPRYDAIQVIGAWGREAVAIFFILSGIVINLSTQNSTDTWLYIKKRFIRIYPIYLAVLIICFSADHFMMHNPVQQNVLVGNLLLSSTLAGYPTPTMPLNPAVWSISCEAFFYIIFGLIYKTNRLRYVWIWFILSCLGILTYGVFNFPAGIPYIICYLFFNSFLWVLGYLIFEYRGQLQTTLPVVLCGILMIPLITRLHKLPSNLFELCYCFEGIFLITLFAYLLRNFSKKDETVDGPAVTIKHIHLLLLYIGALLLFWQYSDSTPVNKIIYSVLPVVSLAFYFPLFTGVLWWAYSRMVSFFTFLADISYPVYLVHMPAMFIMYYLLPEQKLAGMAVAIASTLLLSYIFEVYLFKKLAVFAKKPLPVSTPAEHTII